MKRMKGDLHPVVRKALMALPERQRGALVGFVMKLKRSPVRLVLYRTAEKKGWHAGPNVYSEILTAKGVGKTIGYAIRIRGWCLSLVWRRA